jgi:hypothetical protein
VNFGKTPAGVPCAIDVGKISLSEFYHRFWCCLARCPAVVTLESACNVLDSYTELDAAVATAMSAAIFQMAIKHVKVKPLISTYTPPSSTAVPSATLLAHPSVAATPSATKTLTLTPTTAAAAAVTSVPALPRAEPFPSVLARDKPRQKPKSVTFYSQDSCGMTGVQNTDAHRLPESRSAVLTQAIPRHNHDDWATKSCTSETRPLSVLKATEQFGGTGATVNRRPQHRADALMVKHLEQSIQESVIAMSCHAPKQSKPKQTPSPRQATTDLTQPGPRLVMQGAPPTAAPKLAPMPETKEMAPPATSMPQCAAAPKSKPLHSALPLTSLPSEGDAKSVVLFVGSHSRGSSIAHVGHVQHALKVFPEDSVSQMLSAPPSSVSCRQSHAGVKATTCGVEQHLSMPLIPSHTQSASNTKPYQPTRLRHGMMTSSTILEDSMQASLLNDDEDDQEDEDDDDDDDDDDEDEDDEDDDDNDDDDEDDRA